MLINKFNVYLFTLINSFIFIQPYVTLFDYNELMISTTFDLDLFYYKSNNLYGLALFLFSKSFIYFFNNNHYLTKLLLLLWFLGNVIISYIETPLNYYGYNEFISIYSIMICFFGGMFYHRMQYELLVFSQKHVHLIPLLFFFLSQLYKEYFPNYIGLYSFNVYLISILTVLIFFEEEKGNDNEVVITVLNNDIQPNDIPLLLLNLFQFIFCLLIQYIPFIYSNMFSEHNYVFVVCYLIVIPFHYFFNGHLTKNIVMIVNSIIILMFSLFYSETLWSRHVIAVFYFLCLIYLNLFNADNSEIIYSFNDKVKYLNFSFFQPLLLISIVINPNLTPSLVFIYIITIILIFISILLITAQYYYKLKKSI